jgi:hypothetical protein
VDPGAGDWTLVVMNGDGSAPVLTSVSAGVQAPALRPVAVGAMVGGAVLLLLGVAAIVLAARPRRDEDEDEDLALSRPGPERR